MNGILFGDRRVRKWHFRSIWHLRPGRNRLIGIFFRFRTLARRILGANQGKWGISHLPSIYNHDSYTKRPFTTIHQYSNHDLYTACKPARHPTAAMSPTAAPDRSNVADRSTRPQQKRTDALSATVPITSIQGGFPAALFVIFCSICARCPGSPPPGSDHP